MSTFLIRLSMHYPSIWKLTLLFYPCLMQTSFRGSHQPAIDLLFSLSSELVDVLGLCKFHLYVSLLMECPNIKLETNIWVIAIYRYRLTSGSSKCSLFWWSNVNPAPRIDSVFSYSYSSHSDLEYYSNSIREGQVCCAALSGRCKNGNADGTFWTPSIPRAYRTACLWWEQLDEGRIIYYTGDAQLCVVCASGLAVGTRANMINSLHCLHYQTVEVEKPSAIPMPGDLMNVSNLESSEAVVSKIDCTVFMPVANCGQSSMTCFGNIIANTVHHLSLQRAYIVNFCHGHSFCCSI